MAFQIPSHRSLLRESRLWRIGAATLGTFAAVYIANRTMNSRTLNNATNSSFDWSKEIVVVTGGSGGIGGETVTRLAAGGTTVVVLDVVAPPYQTTDKVHFYQCNLTDYVQVEQAAAKIRSEVGYPSVVIAAAGICRGKPILRADWKDIQVTLGVNTLGLLWTAKVFLPLFVSAGHGHFLIVASQTGYMATAGATDYSASKAAAIAIYEGLQTELKHIHRASSVRISCISPSHVQTAMFNGIRQVPGMASVTPQYVSGVIESILKSGKAQNLIIPPSVGFSPWIRTMPDWVRISLQDIAAGAFGDLDPRDDIAELAETL